jgi:hypothetical protein
VSAAQYQPLGCCCWGLSCCRMDGMPQREEAGSLRYPCRASSLAVATAAYQQQQ